MLPFPFPATDPIKLADWLELYAIISQDRNSSAGDLERVLQRGANLEEEDERSPFDRIAPEVFSELMHRTAAADDAYPFEVGGNAVRLRSAVDEYLAYAFCLCLSYLQWRQERGQRRFPRRLFEKLSTVAIRNYLGGNAVRFGSPRDELPAAFRTAVDRVCLLLGEGASCLPHATFSSKDDHLDVVAWKDFPDELPGKVLLLGQCASGSDWDAKLNELNAEGFLDNWMAETKVSKPIKAFFIPHRIDRQEWKNTSRNAGIVFDRCRVAYWAHRENLQNRAEYADWINEALKSART